MATVGHAHPARDGAATPPHGSQITATHQPRGASNITTTAAALLALTFPIDPAGATATAAIDTVTTVAVATTQATPSHAGPATVMQRPVSTAPPTSPHGTAHWAVPGHTAPAPAILHDVLCVHAQAHIRAVPPHAPRTDISHPSSSHDSPSRRSRSHSCLRSCSPTADHDDYPSYPEKVAQVRLLFADSPAMLAHPPNLPLPGTSTWPAASRPHPPGHVTCCGTPLPRKFGTTTWTN